MYEYIPIYYNSKSIYSRRRMHYANSQKIIHKMVHSFKSPTHSRKHHTERSLKHNNFLNNQSTLPQQQNISNFKQTDRFKKHQNLIQSNKQNIHRMSNTQVGLLKTNLFQIKKIRNSQNITFEPKQLKNHQTNSRLSLQSLPVPELNELSLERVLLKEHMKSKRSLMNYNILWLEKRYNYSRFELHTLHSIYQTLLLDSKNSALKFRNGFQVMLNMNRVSLRPQILEKIFSQHQIIDFGSFLDMNNKIDKIVFKQNITDYVQILFEGITDKSKIRFNQIVRIFKHRIAQGEAIDVAKIIYDQHDKHYEQYIKLQEIIQLCQSCESFAQKMYKLYNQQLKLQ